MIDYLEENCYCTYTQKDSETLSMLDDKFLKLLNTYKIQHWQIPALIRKSILKRCGYFQTMPGQLTAACYIDSKYHQTVSQTQEVPREAFICEDYYYTPAACIHIYPELEGKELRNEIITTKARVYRHEEQHQKGSRLWDFTVREFVAVGDIDFVTQFLSDCQTKAIKLLESINIRGTLKTSNDHFYPSKANQLKERIQRTNKLKRELVVTIDASELAIASFNSHGYHFSKEFAFDSNDKIVTGCVGFGLDRWLYMLNKAGVSLE
jgi:seryl-tRNA synthetase